MAFDPNAPARVTGRRQGGRRWRILMALAALVAVGAVVTQEWLSGWWHGKRVAAAPDVIPATGEPAVYHPPEPPPTLPKPAAVPPPPPPPAAKPEKKAEPRLPTKIAWDAKPTAEPPMGWYVDGRRPMMDKGCALRPGASIIRASLLTRIESEVGGQAIAQVAEDLYDADGVGRVLVPAGTRVVGYYKQGQGLSFDRRRLDFGWTEMTLPDGSQLALTPDGKDPADGGDAGGAIGVGGHVETPWGNLIATAALLSVFDALATVPATTTQDPTAAALATSVGRATSDVGREATQKLLSIEPRITIPAGTLVTILTRRTVRVC